jgi:hypothetical protein
MKDVNDGVFFPSTVLRHAPPARLSMRVFLRRGLGSFFRRRLEDFFRRSLGGFLRLSLGAFLNRITKLNLTLSRTEGPSQRASSRDKIGFMKMLKTGAY